jgi:hypothetical protein
MGRPGRGADLARSAADAENERSAEEVLVKCIACRHGGICRVEGESCQRLGESKGVVPDDDDMELLI